MTGWSLSRVLVLQLHGGAYLSCPHHHPECASDLRALSYRNVSLYCEFWKEIKKLKLLAVASAFLIKCPVHLTGKVQIDSTVGGRCFYHEWVLKPLPPTFSLFQQWLLYSFPGCFDRCHLYWGFSCWPRATYFLYCPLKHTGQVILPPRSCWYTGKQKSNKPAPVLTLSYLSCLIFFCECPRRLHTFFPR